ncbi:MAG: acylphosphatase [Rhizobacter sp.]|nr:acylphosphatase [Chlorobiales bacterium]
MEKRIHVTVSGMVQGVGFRWFVHQRATELKLHGFVRNVPDGRVELEAEGNAAQLESLLREVRLGPAGSSVRGIKVEERQVTLAESGFEIRP